MLLKERIAVTIMNLQRRFRGTCGALLVGLVIAISTAGSAQQTTAPEGDYGYDTRYFTPQEREGRDTWYFWTGGNERLLGRDEPNH